MSFVRELRLHVRKVRDEMAARGVNALSVSQEVDLRYLTGRETGRLLLTPSSATLWVKDVYFELYGGLYSSRGYPLDVVVYDKAVMEADLRGLRAMKIGVSSVGVVEAIRKASKRKVVVCDAVKVARSVKTKWELECIRRSCSIAKAGMRKAGDVIDVGVRELDAVAEIEAEVRRRGSEKPPFCDGMLLASGKRSADIHAKASLKKIMSGSVVVDLGAVYNGYHSDMTRTFSLGSVSAEEKHVTSFVRGLRDEAIGMIRPGMTAKSVHEFVNGRIEKEGFRFHHLTGHGVGLEIHEDPSLGPENKVRLRTNMVFTVEPGIYLPGRFGVRFEDTVLLENRGCRKLT